MQIALVLLALVISIIIGGAAAHAYRPRRSEVRS
jgi:hypothetical protein